MGFENLKNEGSQGLEIGLSVEKAALWERTDSSQRPCQMTHNCLTPVSPRGASPAAHPHSHLHFRAHTHMESHAHMQESESKA